MSRKTLIIAFTILIATLAMSVFTTIKNHQTLSTIRKMPLATIDLSTISDGTYKGKYVYAQFPYRVEVQVVNKRIEQIIILNNRASNYGKKAEAIADQVIKSQSIQVDVISGATISSKALLKAIECSLLSPQQD